MPKDFSVRLWLLKLGAPINLYFLWTTFSPSSAAMDPQVVIPAQVLFAVSAYRCLFPVWYKDNVVLHDTPLSSIFVTRVLATFAEVAWIYLFSEVIRRLNVAHVGWIDALSWLMVFQVVLSQGFVWGAILSGRLVLYFYEELGWAVIFAANTVASAYLHFLHPTGASLGDAAILLELNLLFGLVYLPWQFFHLRALRADAGAGEEAGAATAQTSWKGLAEGLHQSIHARRQTSEAAAWGGLIGLVWMACYWATLIPMWMYQVVKVLSAS